jgi:hypothetical protein
MVVGGSLKNIKIPVLFHLILPIKTIGYWFWIVQNNFLASRLAKQSIRRFHSDCPGNMDFQMTSLLFSKVMIKLNPSYYQGKTFVIAAKNADADNFIIDSIN